MTRNRAAHTYNTVPAQRAVIDNATERRARVVELARQGVTSETIADMLKVSCRTVERARAAAGIAKRFGSIPDSELAWARELLDDGASYFEVARTLGRCQTNLANRLPGYKRTKAVAAMNAATARKMKKVQKLKLVEKV